MVSPTRDAVWVALSLPNYLRKEHLLFLGPATTQNLVVKFDGEICGGVLVEHASDDFPQQKKLENLLPNFAGSSPPILPKTSPTSLWKSLVQAAWKDCITIGQRPRNQRKPSRTVLPKLPSSKDGSLRRGLFTRGISRISKPQNLSRKWSDSHLFFHSLG